MARLFLGLAAVFGLLAVALGAFAAHGLKARLAPEALAVFQTGAQYQMYHALALGLVALWARGDDGRWLGVAGWSFVAGVALFSGSLYALALSGVRGLGAVTPLGGVAFLVGWLALALHALRGR